MNSFQTENVTPLPDYIFNAKSACKNVPARLKQIPQWVLWKYEIRNGKTTKVPKLASGQNADPMNPAAWLSFDLAISHAGRFSGVGLVLTKEAGLTVIDLDHVSDWPEKAQTLIDSFPTYAEHSPSGDGVHIFVDGLKTTKNSKTRAFYNSQVELYDSARYITFTGEALAGKPLTVEPCRQAFTKLQNDLDTAKAARKPTNNDWLHKAQVINFDQATQLHSAVSGLPSTSANDASPITERDVFDRLERCGKRDTLSLLSLGCSPQDDESAKDLAACNDLAFVTGKDPALMDLVIRNSALMRPKWDENRGGQTYGELTIKRAINDTRSIYSDKEKAPTNTPAPAGLSLESFVITLDQVEQMKDEIAQQVFVLPGIALRGQFTMLYAAPNTGKTLLTIKQLTDSIDAGLIDGRDVFYINADDNRLGVVEKTEIMSRYGINHIAPSVNGFKEGLFVALLQRMIDDGTAANKIIVLDTMKKFVDLMNKRESSDFNKVLRGFTTAGGTVICLAHVNKNKDAEGKPIYAGTSDANDDCDCSFVMAVKSENVDSFQGKTIVNKTVEYTQKKARGMVEQSVVYSYMVIVGNSYASMLDGVKKVDADKANWEAQQNEIAERLTANQGGINCVRSAIERGVNSKGELIKVLMDEEGLSKPKARALIDIHEGRRFQRGHRWTRESGDKNASFYSLVMPSI